MKRRNFLGSVALASSCLAFAVSPAVAGAQEDEAAILEIWSTYSTARVAGDAEAWLALWDPEGVRMPPGRPAVDYATFSKGIPAKFAGGGPSSMEIRSDEVVLMGDWAFSSGTYTVEGDEGKFLTIFRRQDDGSWRIYRDAFSMNED